MAVFLLMIKLVLKHLAQVLFRNRYWNQTKIGFVSLYLMGDNLKNKLKFEAFTLKGQMYSAWKTRYNKGQRNIQKKFFPSSGGPECLFMYISCTLAGTAGHRAQSCVIKDHRARADKQLRHSTSGTRRASALHFARQVRFLPTCRVGSRETDRKRLKVKRADIANHCGGIRNWICAMRRKDQLEKDNFKQFLKLPKATKLAATTNLHATLFKWIFFKQDVKKITLATTAFSS